MKRALCTVAALLIATAAFAGSHEMTPQQAWEKTMNCPVCSAWSMDPALGPTLRYNVQTTKNGFIEVFQTANENMKASYDKCEAECMKRIASIPTMSADHKAKLCPLCTTRAQIDRQDVTFENAKTSLGSVRVASASTPEGVKALHAYAAARQKHSELMQQASKEMQGKDVQKAKM